MNKNVLKTIGKDTYEVEFGYINTIKINGIDEWFKVKVITEPRMFDSYGSDSSKLYFVDIQGKPKDYHGHLKETIAKDYEKLELKLESNFNSKRIHFVTNKMYFKWFASQEEQMFQNYMNGVKQDWGVSQIQIDNKIY